jgi:hypothetical protein
MLTPASDNGSDPARAAPEKYTRRCRYCNAGLSDFSGIDFCDDHEGMIPCLACGSPLEAGEIVICARCSA